jgi:hypothetical protein
MTLNQLKVAEGVQRYFLSVSPPISSQNEVVGKLLATSNEISAAPIIFSNDRIDFPYDACTKLIRLIEFSTIRIQGGSL